jgi:hypothetical protein
MKLLLGIFVVFTSSIGWSKSFQEICILHSSAIDHSTGAICETVIASIPQ